MSFILTCAFHLFYSILPLALLNLTQTCFLLHVCSFCLFQDQYENISLHTQKGIDFLERYGHFIKDRSNIEMEYAKSLRYVTVFNRFQWRDYSDVVSVFCLC